MGKTVLNLQETLNVNNQLLLLPLLPPARGYIDDLLALLLLLVRLHLRVERLLEQLHRGGVELNVLYHGGRVGEGVGEDGGGWGGNED